MIPLPIMNCHSSFETVSCSSNIIILLYPKCLNIMILHHYIYCRPNDQHFTTSCVTVWYAYVTLSIIVFSILKHGDQVFPTPRRILYFSQKDILLSIQQLIIIFSAISYCYVLYQTCHVKFYQRLAYQMSNIF